MVVVGATSSPRNVHGDDSSADDSDNNEDVTIVRKKAKVNNDVPPQGSNMQQPMGMKKAKLMKKFEDLLVAVTALPFDSLVSNNSSNILADMSNATKDLVVAFKANASLKRDELRMRTHDKWMKMATMYMFCGKQDMALMMMQEIQDDDDQTASNRNSPPRTIARAVICPAFMDIRAGERQIPNEVEVMATEQEENNQVTAAAVQEHHENNEKGIDKATPNEV